MGRSACSNERSVGEGVLGVAASSEGQGRAIERDLVDPVEVPLSLQAMAASDS